MMDPTPGAGFYITAVICILVVFGWITWQTIEWIVSTISITVG